MRIYVAGPMRGYVNWNFAAFDRAVDMLERQGHTAISPAALDRVLGRRPDDSREATDPYFMRHCLALDTLVITQECDALAVLPGWMDSLGAQAEVALALAIKLPIYHANQFTANGRLREINITGYLKEAPSS